MWTSGCRGIEQQFAQHRLQHMKKCILLKLILIWLIVFKQINKETHNWYQFYLLFIFIFIFIF